MSYRSVASVACALALTAGTAVFGQQPALSGEALAKITDQANKNESSSPFGAEEIHVISARAGGINLIQGTVSVLRKAETNWTPAVSQKRLKTGDRLRTGIDGRAEMLLNPGSYLRLDHESEIELTNPTLDQLVVTITRGTTLFEVTGAKDTRLYITVETPQGRVLITQAGVYRIGVRPDGAVEATVRKGVLQLASVTGQKIGDGRVVILNGKTVNVAKVDKKAAEDAFEVWSQGRAEMLAQANERLRRQAANVRNTLNRYRNGGAYGFGYAPYFGLWFFDASIGCHAFYPFYGGWRSGYGFNYPQCYGLPWRDFTPIIPPPPVPTGATAGVRNTGGQSGGGVGVGPTSDGPFLTRSKAPGATNSGPVIPGDGTLTRLPGRTFPTQTEAALIRGGYNNGGGYDGNGGVFGGRNSDSSSSGGDIFRGSSTPSAGGYNRGYDPPPKADAPAPSAAPAGPAPTTIPKQ